MANTFPTTVNAFTNPTSTTFRDDTGFELDVVIANIQDAIEADETKIGTGASTPAANTVLRGTASGVSSWGTVATAMLAANAVTQYGIASGTGTSTLGSTATWADIGSVAVTLTTVGGDLLCFLVGAVKNSTLGAAMQFGIRLDAGSESFVVEVAAQVANYATGIATLGRFTGVSAASHTVYARWLTGSATMTGSSGPYLLVVELKR